MLFLKRIFLTAALVMAGVLCFTQVGFSAPGFERSLRIPNHGLLAGLPVSVPIEFEAAGEERSVSFSIRTDPGLLRHVRTDLAGTTPGDARLSVDTRFVQLGYVGVTISTEQGFQAGRRIIANVVLYTDGLIVPGSEPITFQNIPNSASATLADGTVLPLSSTVGSFSFGIADPFMTVVPQDVTVAPAEVFEMPVRFGGAFSGFLRATSVSFSIAWNPGSFEYQSARIGTLVPSGMTFDIDESQILAGKLGVTLAGTTPFVDSMYYELLRVRLLTRNGALAGYHPISVLNSPTPLRTVDAQGQSLGVAWRPGFVTVGIPSLPLSRVSGNVYAPGSLAVRNAVVTLISSRGDRRTTTTGPFGNFLFTNIPADQYMISVASKRYRIPVQNINVTASISGIRIEALE